MLIQLLQFYFLHPLFIYFIKLIASILKLDLKTTFFGLVQMNSKISTSRNQILGKRVSSSQTFRSLTKPKKIDHTFRGSAWETQPTLDFNSTFTQNQSESAFQKEEVQKKAKEKLTTIPSEKHRWNKMEENQLYRQILGRLPFKSEVGELLKYEKRHFNKNLGGQLQMVSSSYSNFKSLKNFNPHHTKHTKIVATNKVSLQAISSCFQQEKKLQKWYSTHKHALKIF